MPNCEACGDEIRPDSEHFTHYEPTNAHSTEIHAACSPECMADYLETLDEDADEEDDG